MSTAESMSRSFWMPRAATVEFFITRRERAAICWRRSVATWSSILDRMPWNVAISSSQRFLVRKAFSHSRAMPFLWYCFAVTIAWVDFFSRYASCWSSKSISSCSSSMLCRVASWGVGWAAAVFPGWVGGWVGGWVAGAKRAPVVPNMRCTARMPGKAQKGRAIKFHGSGMTCCSNERTFHVPKWHAFISSEPVASFRACRGGGGARAVPLRGHALVQYDQSNTIRPSAG